MWQEIIVGICVIAATAFLIKRWLPVFTQKSNDCGSGCGSCGTTKQSCSKVD